MASEVPIHFENDPVYQAAADWLVRLQQPSLSLEETIEWQQWANADPRHAVAFAEVEELWGRLDGIKWPASDNASPEQGRPYDGTLTVSEWRSTRSDPVARHSCRERSRRLAWTMAACLALATVGATSMLLSHASRATAYETAIATNRTVTLADGSIIELAADSRCDVTLENKLRRVTLVRGEALFHVAKDPTRPFRVRAGNAEVEAVGTEFDIRRTAAHVVVSVIEGRILVQPTQSLSPGAWLNWVHADGEPAALSAGNWTSVDQNGLRPATKIVSSEATLAWRHGQLVFEGEPLRDVVEDVNRYSDTPIALDDERMGDVLITGTLSVSDIDSWIASLSSAFGIRAEHRAGRIVLKQETVSG